MVSVCDREDVVGLLSRLVSRSVVFRSVFRVLLRMVFRIVFRVVLVDFFLFVRLITNNYEGELEVNIIVQT